MEENKTGKENKIGVLVSMGWASDSGVVQGMKGGSKSCTYLPVGGENHSRKREQQVQRQQGVWKNCKATSGMEHWGWWQDR